jgi:hypothetical protein
MGGRKDDQSFNSDPNTGRKGYREPGEPVDDRPLVVYGDFRRSYKRDEYGRVVEAAGNPPPDDDDRWLQGARRVMAMPDFETIPLEQKLRMMVEASGQGGGKRVSTGIVRSMPKVRSLSEDEFNRRMAKLREQASGLHEPRAVRLPYREPGED